MTLILAIDPGPDESAFVEYRYGKPDGKGKWDNERLLKEIPFSSAQHMAIEMIASYGMPVGREVFETCVWIGRFIQAWQRPYTMVYRKDVKLHICDDSRAKDSNILQALYDRYGPGRKLAVGTKANPGPCYGFSGDMWAALAVAITYHETASTASLGTTGSD